MLDLSIQVDPASVSRLEAQMARARTELGKTVRDSMDWAGRFVAKSLAASTKIAPKLRPIVSNPAFRGKGAKRRRADMRRARFGVMAPTGPDRVMTFRPISRTGEFGKVRFFDKNSMSWFRRDASNPKGKWESIPSGQVEGLSEAATIPGIQTDKRRVIGRRGLAKKAWSWVATHITTGGTSTLGGYGDKVSVHWGGLIANRTLRIKDRLKYAQLAFRTKGKTVDSVLLRASDNMRNRIDSRLKKVANA